MHQARLRGADRLNRRLHLVLHKEMSPRRQRLRRALELHVVVRLRTAHRRRHHQQVVSANRARERHLALQVVDGRLPAHRAIAGHVVIRGKHAADAGNAQSVIVKRLQRLVHAVTQVRTVMVAVQLDIRHLELRQPRRRLRQRFAPESPIAPGSLSRVFSRSGDFFFSSSKRALIRSLPSSKCCIRMASSLPLIRARGRPPRASPRARPAQSSAASPVDRSWNGFRIPPPPSLPRV